MSSKLTQQQIDAEWAKYEAMMHRIHEAFNASYVDTDGIQCALAWCAERRASLLALAVVADEPSE